MKCPSSQRNDLSHGPPCTVVTSIAVLLVIHFAIGLIRIGLR